MELFNDNSIIGLVLPFRGFFKKVLFEIWI